jgi:excisionase family DNA binding protein
MIDRKYLSPKEFAALTGLGIATVYRYVRSGQVPSEQPAGFKGRLMIPRDALDQFEGDTASPAADPGHPTPPTGGTPQRLSGPSAKWRRRAP